MSEPEQEKPGSDRREPEARPFNAVEMLSSMRFAIGLVIAIAVACVVATVLPQGPEVAERLQRNPEAGRWLKRLTAAGLTSVFTSWWFIGLLTALGASLAACVTRRAKGLAAGQVAPGPARVRRVGTLLVHSGLLLTLLGGVVRLIWSERGSIQFREGEQVQEFVTDDNRREPLPFTLQLMKFELEHYPAPVASQAPAAPAETLAIQWPGTEAGAELPVEIGVERDVPPPAAASATNAAVRVTVLRRVSDFALDTATRTVTSRSNQMLNPAILVRVTGLGAPLERWLFARYPDFGMDAGGGHESQPVPLKMVYRVLVPAADKPHIKSFKSTLRVLQGAVVLREQTIEVNAPLLYGGYGFYQASYREEDPSWTALLVVRDPGVPVVYAGFILLIAGVFVTACWRPEGARRAEQVRENKLC